MVAAAPAAAQSATALAPVTGPAPSKPELFELAQLIELKMGHELNLIGQRMTWILVSQSFLFGAWTQVRGASEYPLHRGALFMAIGLIGGVTPLVAYPPTLAALQMHDVLLDARQAIETALGFDVKLVPLMGRGRKVPWTLWAGNLPPLLLPPFFFAVWMAIGAASWWHFERECQFIVAAIAFIVPLGLGQLLVKLASAAGARGP
jgi:hypothetical protein